MQLSEFCIKRPVFATVLSLLLVAVGLMGLTYLDTRYLPRFDSNHLTVLASYPGASAQLIETSVTTPLEDAVSGVEGIDTVTSTSSQNYTQLDIALQDGVDVNEAANKVRAQVDNARSSLPTGVAAPQVQIRNVGASEIMDIGVTHPTMPLAAIRDYLARNVINQIKQIPGVAMVNLTGANSYVMRISIDPKKMVARQVTLADIQVAIQKNNVELPAGKIHGTVFDYPVTATTKINTVEQFNHLVINQNNDRYIYLKDVASAKMTTDPTSDSVVRLNGEPGILMSVTTTDSANPIDTAHAITLFMKKLSTQLPTDMHIVTAYDQSIFMRDSIHEVYTSIFFAIACVLVVIYLFLGEWRSVFVPIVTIPICLFATFGLMYCIGFTINIITLLALVLSIGLVVDDAIVMLENVYRHIEEGMTPLAAALKGSREIAFAVIAMTLTLAAVYAPVGFVHGKIAAIFKPFAFTLAGAVIISGFVALTLSPMMCAQFLKPQKVGNRYAAQLDKWFGFLTERYARGLDWLLAKRYVVASIMVLIMMAGFFLFRSFSFGFMPDEDMGLVIAQANTPSGANIHLMSEVTAKSASLLKNQASVQSVMSIADTSQQGYNFSFATLKPFSERHSSSREVADHFNQQVAQVPGLAAYAFPISFGGSMKSQLQFVITSDQSYNALYKTSDALVKQLNQYPGIKNASSSLNFDSQQYEIHVKRDLAAQLNVSVQDIDSMIAAMLGGIKVSSIDVSGQSYDVYLMGEEGYQRNLQSLDEFNVVSPSGKSIPLSNLVTVTPVLSQTVLTHFERQRSATINATLGEGYSLGDVVGYLQQHLPELLPEGVHYTFQGAAKNISDTSNSMGIIFLLALGFIYLVLCAQFESFLDPLVILLAVPFSVIGALLALKLIDGGINIYTIVGLVTLIGLVAKHGILITQFANDKLREGLSVSRAVREAAITRLRPILMTTAAMIFGAMPLLFASGASAASRQQIGAVIISGLFFGTFFSLVLVPATYTFMHKLRRLWQ